MLGPHLLLLLLIIDVRNGCSGLERLEMMHYGYNDMGLRNVV